MDPARATILLASTCRSHNLAQAKPVENMSRFWARKFLNHIFARRHITNCLTNHNWDLVWEAVSQHSTRHSTGVQSQTWNSGRWTPVAGRSREPPQSARNCSSWAPKDYIRASIRISTNKRYFVVVYMVVRCRHVSRDVRSGIRFVCRNQDAKMNTTFRVCCCTDQIKPTIQYFNSIHWPSKTHRRRTATCPRQKCGDDSVSCKP